jgi:hypothetical protein
VTSNRLPAFSQIDRIMAPDPLTVVITMKQVDASIMDTFASPWNSIFSAARLAQDPAFPVRNVMGSGPFRFVEHVAGSHWVGERFDGYFRQGQPYLDGFRAITMTPSAMVNALSGRQILAEFRGFTPNERDRIVRALGQDAQVHESSWMLHMIVSFNNERAPFNDPRVRRGPLAFRRLRAPDPRYLRAASALAARGLPVPSGLWARRSVFTAGHWQLLVTEVFLPAVACLDPAGAPARAVAVKVLKAGALAGAAAHRPLDAVLQVRGRASERGERAREESERERRASARGERAREESEG